jgi:hypothetical protein
MSYDELNNNQFTLKQSIWKQTQDGEWKLFFNTDAKLDASEVSEIPKYQNEINTNFLNKKILKMGSLVMTPKGIGRLIRLEENISKIKFLKTDTEENFEISKISSEFFILIKVLEVTYSTWYRLSVPANGTIQQLKKLIEDLSIYDTNKSNYVLVYKGIELKDEYFFDQLDIKSNAKMLISGMKMSESKIQRFTNIYDWWYTYSSDGISFFTNKKIRITGVGMFGSHENKTQNGTLSIYKGNVSSQGGTLYEENIEIPPAPDKLNSVMSIYFKKPVVINAFDEHTIVFVASNYCYIYYGNDGKAQYNCTNGVEFNFKFTNGSSHGSTMESGNFPEFYFFG